MAEKVDRVPNLWEPYMEGIWAFDFDEFQRMPKWSPSIDPDTGIVIGIRQWLLTVGNKIYVQFSDSVPRNWYEFWGIVPPSQERLF